MGIYSEWQGDMAACEGGIGLPANRRAGFSGCSGEKGKIKYR